MRRRDFIRLGGVLAGASAQSAYAGLPNAIPGATSQSFLPRADQQTGNIDFLHDGLALSAKEYSELLMRLADEGKIKTDYYSNGGVVEEMENKFATLMGKESAVFLPTGTLANHMAVRRLAGNRPRAIIQEQSHLYNDSGDCVQVLSNINLIPLGQDAVCFDQKQLTDLLAKSKTGRVETKVGVVCIETPVRRKLDRMVDFSFLESVKGLSQKEGFATHLDGARLFVQCAHTNKSPAAFGALFDTVYTSLWKCFNAASGAVLCGSKSFTDNFFHERRMFGGSLPAAWPFAAVALHYADSFITDYKAAWIKATQLFADLKKNGNFEITELEGGSHIVWMKVKGIDPEKFRQSLLKKNIELPPHSPNGFLLKINPSLNKASSISAQFIDSLK